MAQPADRPGSLTNLQKRILSAAVLLPLVAVAIIFGGAIFTVVVAVFAGVAAWEWTQVVVQKIKPGQPAVPAPLPPARPWLVPSIASVAVAMLTVLGVGIDTGIDWVAVFGLGLVLVILGTAVARVMISGFMLTGEAERRHFAMWFTWGTAYAALPAAALVALRADPELGRATLFWIIALVVAADTGGYLVGRTLGGPKLAPRISPNKTWSGLAGAVAGAALAGLSAAFVLNHTDVWMLTLMSAGLGLVEQAGDLVESAFKRHFGVKDTSQIIPGHGGVLDRVDGLLAVAVAVWIANEWAGGSVLAW
jgi:phosphatidate cytidylyltransferase